MTLVTWAPVVAYSQCGDEGNIYPNWCAACTAQDNTRYIELEECGPYCPKEVQPVETLAVQQPSKGQLKELPPTLPPQDDDCPQYGPPACGFTNTGKSVQFKSECEACKDSSIVFHHYGNCYEKPDYSESGICFRQKCYTNPMLPWPQCIPTRSPVCGYTRDGKEVNYGSSCEACLEKDVEITHWKAGHCDCKPPKAFPLPTLETKKAAL